MINHGLQDEMFPKCPVRNVLARIGDKWSLLVMHELNKNGKASMRFGELNKKLPDVSQKVLTQTLRRLEEDGFVTRSVYAEVPPRVEYALTERAESFLEACRPMIGWAIAHFVEIMASRRSYRGEKAQ